jgi:hypothetical protein
LGGIVQRLEETAGDSSGVPKAEYRCLVGPLKTCSMRNIVQFGKDMTFRLFLFLLSF